MEELMQLRGLQYQTSFLEDVPLLVTSGVITPYKWGYNSSYPFIRVFIHAL